MLSNYLANYIYSIIFRFYILTNVLSSKQKVSGNFFSIFEVKWYWPRIVCSFISINQSSLNQQIKISITFESNDDF